MRTEEANLLLAEFVGVEKTDLKDSFNEVIYRLPDEIREFMHCSHFGHLRFHESWDWLMVVVEKIETICPKDNVSEQFRVKISGRSCDILDMFRDGSDYQKDFLKIYFNMHESKRSTVWHACVKFVQWYNLNKETYE